MCTLSHGHDVRRSLTSCTSSLFPEDFHQFLPINKYLDLFSMRQLMSSLIIVISGRVQVSEKSVIHPRLMIFTICFSLTELSSTTEEFRKGSHKDLRLQENYGKLHRDLNGISAIPRVIDRQPWPTCEIKSNSKYVLQNHACCSEMKTILGLYEQPSPSCPVFVLQRVTLICVWVWFGFRRLRNLYPSGSQEHVRLWFVLWGCRWSAS